MTKEEPLEDHVVDEGLVLTGVPHGGVDFVYRVPLTLQTRHRKLSCFSMAGGDMK